MLTHVHALGKEECIGLRFLLVLKPKLHGVDILSGKRHTLIRARPTRRELAECNAYTAERLYKAVYIYTGALVGETKAHTKHVYSLSPFSHYHKH